MIPDQSSESHSAPKAPPQKSLRRLVRRLVRRRQKPQIDKGDEFLTTVKGVIHVGANAGQESGVYAGLGLHVIWVEPDPDVFDVLRQNISSYPKQRAFKYLVTDEDDIEVDFHVANNAGLSSSILDLKLHQEVWPQVTFEKTIRMTTCTLDTLLRRENLRTEAYRALVLDTQGSELLVLKGAQQLLKHISYVKVEVPDFESYSGCCQLSDIEPFMHRHGFHEFHRSLFANRPRGGAYYDIVYSR